MSDDFTSAVGRSVGKAAVGEASAKFGCKDINFKEPRTWGWLLGIVSACLLVSAGFGTIVTNGGAAFFAIVLGAALLLLEFFCCFKCCAKTKDCATKADKYLASPFLKGAAYIVVAIIGIVVSALTCVG